MSTPIPTGRGRWRVTLHSRTYSTSPGPIGGLQIGELFDAQSRQLTQQWNQPAQFLFTLDGHSENAKLVQELTTDVCAWRWDEASGADVCMFRGIVAQSQDTLSEQTHTVVFTCHDYLSMLDRRYLPYPLTYTQTDQDDLVGYLLALARGMTAGPFNNPTSLFPGSNLPLGRSTVSPDGSGRPSSGTLRDRTWTAGSSIGQLLADLAAVIGGFDFDLQYCYVGNALDILRVWWPQQGVTRSEPLVFGSNVASLTRSVNSADYSNYWRVIGGSGSSDATAPPQTAEAWNADANNVGVSPQGLWQSIDSGSNDVIIPSALQEKAAGDLALSGVLIPSYSLVLRPSWYSYGAVNMGDSFTLVVHSGRLDLVDAVRVLGITFDIGDDGEEDVGLTVGRPAQSLLDVLTRPNQTIQALARR
jgi:hypothetical protein